MLCGIAQRSNRRLSTRVPVTVLARSFSQLTRCRTTRVFAYNESQLKCWRPRVAILQQQNLQAASLRWMHSEKPNETNAKDEKATEEEKASSSSSSSSNTRNMAALAAQQVEERLKRVVTDLNVGDQMSVILIVVLTATILTAPWWVRYAQKSDTNEDYTMTMTDDPVDDLMQLANKEFSPEEKQNAVEYVLKDVMQSQALQRAALQFVLQIVNSPEFKEAITRLVKELWADLVSDPETIAQVVKLLQVAIQNEEVKLAAQKLVIGLVQEEEVKQALIDVLQRLGLENEVQAAVQELLMNSAHNALNDAEILDHSMEFATDVLGDDIVQQTAGEALRNTVGHAFKPVSSILLTAAGVGLMIFGIFSIGYARSSDQDIVLFESAARSLQANARFGIVRILTWPARAVQKLLHSIGRLLWMPVEFVHGQLRLAGETIYSGVAYALARIVSIPIAGAQALLKAISRCIEAVIYGTTSWILAAERSVVGGVASISSNAMLSFVRMFQAMWESVNRSSLRLVNSTKQTMIGWEDAFLAFLLRIEEAIVQVWRGVAR